MRVLRTITLASLVLAGCGGSGTNRNGGGSVQFTASGEVLALDGYAFPAVNSGDPTFVDGWEVHFSKFLAVFDQVTLSANPDTSGTDQSQTGKVVAEIDGPWAVDLHQSANTIPGKGGGNEVALPIATIENENKNGGRAFDPTLRYAFGFASVPATATTILTNIDAADPDWQAMVANGWNVLYVGTATWKGGASCRSTGASTYDFSSLPTTVNFRLGFATPASYVNCQNPDNDPAMGLGDEGHERGVQVKDNQVTVAQVTFHTDHPFWESFTHDTPAHFDQLAALAKPQADGSFLVTLDDTVGVDYQTFRDPTGAPLPWRACDDSYTPPNSAPQMGFDSLSVPFSPSGDPSLAVRDYFDYMRYDQSTQGHLNSDGLCYVRRGYPSPQ